jgi:hypothetical protein
VLYVDARFVRESGEADQSRAYGVLGAATSAAYRVAAPGAGGRTLTGSGGALPSLTCDGRCDCVGHV